MKKLRHMTTVLFSVAVFGAAWLGIAAPAQAEIVTDTLFLELTGKEWCKNDPRFFDTLTSKVKDGDIVVFSLTRDTVSGDIQATIDTSGGNASADAITLHGKALLATASGTTAELVLSGTEPDHADHFFTLRGKATINKVTGKITKVSGTYVFQFPDWMGEVLVDCFSNGTFVTQPLSKAGPVGGGSIAIAGAPAYVGGKFVSNKKYFSQGGGGTVASVFWVEFGGTHAEGLDIVFDSTTNQITSIAFASADLHGGLGWGCGIDCSGVTVNNTAGFIKFDHVVLTGQVNTGTSITLNGTLTFAPF